MWRQLRVESSMAVWEPFFATDVNGSHSSGSQTVATETAAASLILLHEHARVLAAGY